MCELFVALLKRVGLEDFSLPGISSMSSSSSGGCRTISRDGKDCGTTLGTTGGVSGRGLRRGRPAFDTFWGTGVLVMAVDVLG